MINLNELEKVITAGKVVTLVIMIDGKELAAMSFTVDTVAFKEILETVVKKTVTIAEKSVDKKVEPEKKTTKSETKVLEKKTEKFAETVTEIEKQEEEATGPDQWSNEEEEDDNDNDSGVDPKTGADKETGEIKETIPDSKEPTNAQREAYERELETRYEPQRGSVSAGPPINDFNPPASKPTVADSIAQSKKRIEAVAASTLEEDIIPEETVIVDKKETVKTDGKDEKAQTPATAAGSEINFSDEKW